MGSVPWSDILNLRPSRPSSGIVERACHASNHCFGYGVTVEKNAWATAVVEAEIAAEVVFECIAAYCAVAKVEKAEVVRSTCAKERSRALDFELQEAFLKGPWYQGSFPEAFQC
jgi:hypothetical protein